MLSQIIDYDCEPVTVHLKKGEYIKGIYRTETTKVETKMAVCHVSSKDLKMFEQGKLTVEDFKFYDYKRELDIKEHDVIEASGKKFQVIKVSDRSRRGFNIYYGRRITDKK